MLMVEFITVCTDSVTLERWRFFDTLKAEEFADQHPRPQDLLWFHVRPKRKRVCPRCSYVNTWDRDRCQNCGCKL
jgi:uncharacterized paraquat-inducible protein A